MRKLNVVKERVASRVYGMKETVKDKAVLASIKLREKEGSLLEYLGEHIIGVVIIGIVLALLVTIIKNTVGPSIVAKIESAFNFSA